MSPTRALAEQLIARRSVTPDDGGCQELLAARLRPLGFACESLVFGNGAAQVTNLWARRDGAAGAATLVFAGHTDVVPTGPLERWTSDPFIPTERAGHLHGRGAADMKSSLAAMVVAVEEFVAARPRHAGHIAFLVTSDEEGPARDGTVRVCEWLAADGVRLDYCIVGEPTSVERTGDMIKNGRRGSLSGRLCVRGVQGHVAYPQLARNPIHLAAPILAELAAVPWDRGNGHFPPTTWQVSNVHAGTGAGNVIPGELVADFNFRFSSESTPESLRARLESIVAAHGVDFTVAWTLGGEPFLTPAGALSRALAEAIRERTGIETTLSTTGGTSDGRFIKRICPEVIEFGPVNATIHQVDESIEIASLEVLKDIYRGALERLVA